MKRLAKLLTTFTMLVATIQSAKIEQVEFRGGSSPALCASFVIQDIDPEHNNRVLKQSEQCGQSWDSIKKGIRDQLKQEQIDIDAEQQEHNREKELERIKNDFVGYTIR